MSRQPKPDPIQVLRDLNPASAHELRAGMAGDEHRAAARRAVELAARGGGEPEHGYDDVGVARRTAPSRRSLLAATALTLAGAIAAIVLLGGSSVGPGEQPAFAQSAVEVAEGNPRLLVGAPGWSVTYANEFEPDQGQIDFSNGGETFTVDWAPAEYYSDPLDASGSEPGQWYRSTAVGCLTESGDPIDCATYFRYDEVSVLGVAATLHESRTVIEGEEPRSSFSVALPPEESVYVQVHANSMPRARFLGLLDSLYATDVETWLGALPAETVQPLERPEVVDEMLAGVPVPPTVDVEELKGEPAALNRYHLGAAVTAAVACGWLDQWAAAVDTGDTVRADEAIAAMSTSREWPILEEMAPQGGWSQTIWQYAGELQRGERAALLGSSGTEGLSDGRVYELSPSYASGLGCESERRTLREGESSLRKVPSEPVPSPRADRGHSDAGGQEPARDPSFVAPD